MKNSILLILISISSVFVGGLISNAYGQKPEEVSRSTVEIVGHRGAAYLAPENTIASLKKAIELGADAVEVDIHLSKDGEIVVIHDYTTNRTTNQDFVVAEENYSTLEQLDAGSFKSIAFKGEKIPLLKDVLEYLPEDIILYIEIKAKAEIISTLEDLLAEHEKIKQFRIIAFDIETLTKTKKQLPSIPCYFLKSTVNAKDYSKLIRDLKKRGLDGADLGYKTITKKLVKKLNRAGMPCLAWTVNSAEQARKLIEMGVVGITTDKPGFLKKSI